MSWRRKEETWRGTGPEGNAIRESSLYIVQKKTPKQILVVSFVYIIVSSLLQDLEAFMGGFITSWEPDDWTEAETSSLQI